MKPRFKLAAPFTEDGIKWLVWEAETFGFLGERPITPGTTITIPADVFRLRFTRRQ
jgi:hypothetical protein